MVKLNITMDNDVLLQLQMALARFGEGSMPGVSSAMQASAGLVRGTWQSFARGGSLPGIESLKNPGGKYARSIKIDRKGPFDYEIYSEAKVAEWIENGTDELDMKTTHPFGPRSRVAHTGKNRGYPYLIVPFRWGTPRTVGFRNIMPESVYKIVKNKKKFRQTKTTVSADKSDFKTENASGEMVGRAQYSDVLGSRPWGDRLAADMGEGITDNMVGMSSMSGQNGKAAGYLTFRVISAAPGATGWIRPATRARPVTRAVAGVTQETVNDIIDSAVREDLGL
ncbi:MAG: hypothetical protein LBG27_03245 [Spirochaetaceae bacterium]|jgi:hypothetical protein|nr:hypothetical protein [Spirochaetaceae bacterium]